MSEPARKPVGGRPRAAEAAAVAAVGLRLFAEHGFEAVTMTRIAEESGISRSTLLRYFPTKLDIVWDRTADEMRELRRLLAETPVDEDAIDSLCAALPRVLDYADEDLDLLRTQVSIISASAGGSVLGLARFATWRDVVLEFVEDRTGQPRDGLFARVLVQCVADVGWAALLVWAETDELRPDRLIDEAYGHLRTAFRHPGV